MIATDAPLHAPLAGARKNTDQTSDEPTAAVSAPPSRKALWAGRVLSALAVLFLVVDATMKLLQLPVAMQVTRQLGYPESAVFALGIVQAVCLVVYLVPRTAVLGAILWTGYLGGAVATHVRVGDPLFSHVLFPVYVAAFLWLGIWIRDRRLRAVLPVRQ